MTEFNFLATQYDVREQEFLMFFVICEVKIKKLSIFLNVSK
jgi:hypothetical protein